jgi:exodeoxyribonuclease-3
MKLKVATWNVNSVRARMPVIRRWIEKESPDILCMQELKATDGQFPFHDFNELGYNSFVNGQVRWNGVAIVSRCTVADIEMDLMNFLPDQKRIITCTVSGIRLINVYVPNGGEVNSRGFLDKLEYFEVLRKYALASPLPTVILGDFNVAPGPADTHSPDEQNGTVCYHPLEREQIKEFQSAGFTDVFRKFHPLGKAYSWWDYREMAWKRGRGMRLDLVLANKTAEALLIDCIINPEPRGWDKPSDHTPVVFTIGIPE